MLQLAVLYYQDKKTPLHKAAENGQFDVCETLLSHNAEVSLVDEVSRFNENCTHDIFCDIIFTQKGQTPLHLAAENDHSKVIKQFLRHGNLVTMTNKEGSTCAHIAAAKGSAAVIEELLKFNSENVTKATNKVDLLFGFYNYVNLVITSSYLYSRQTQQTALLQAARGGHAEVVKKLICAGANLMDEDAVSFLNFI